MIHGNEELFAGLDVSMNRTSLCLVDASGDVIWRGACTTDPESLAATIRRVGADRSTRIHVDPPRAKSLKNLAVEAVTSEPVSGEIP